MALLPVCLNLLERLISNRISPAKQIIPQEQAGFRSMRNQALALKNVIEEKTVVTFVNLTAAWKKGVIFTLLKIIPCLKLCNLIMFYPK